ncbi:MAG TPA: DUF6734 family protein [Puia sp.]|nr:DUF6734 family protein [Puia sp.]
MKIIQSFWTKPILAENVNTGGSRMNGGWPHRMLNYCSWAMSCLQLRTFYDSVELVTDRLGKEILIDALQLPYSKVHVELDSLHAVHHGLWSIGKLYAYGMQKEPFIHVDNDVFIWADFGAELCRGDVIAQNVQYETSSYSNTFQDILKTFPCIPEYLRQYDGMKFVPCINAGILGGNDIEFIKKYVNEALTFIEDNKCQIIDRLSYTDFEDVNVICEQVMLSAFATAKEKKITCLFPDHKDVPDGIGVFHEARNNQQFVHCLGGYKKLRIVYAGLENRLRAAFPFYYKRITDLISTIEL